MYPDPNTPRRPHQQVEPMQGAEDSEPTWPASYNNPYEPNTPYPGAPPVPPPPPQAPKPGRTIVPLALVIVALLILIGGALLYIVVRATTQTTSTSPSPTSQVAPTPRPTQPIIVTTVVTTVIVNGSQPQSTPLVQVPYRAQSIYNAFNQAGIRMGTASWDNNWKCCTYYPEGNAIVWRDPSGANVDIATFVSPGEANEDASQLAAQSFGTYTHNNCLLSFDTTLPSQAEENYIQVMNVVCKG